MKLERERIKEFQEAAKMRMAALEKDIAEYKKDVVFEEIRSTGETAAEFQRVEDSVMKFIDYVITADLKILLIYIWRVSVCLSVCLCSQIFETFEKLLNLLETFSKTYWKLLKLIGKSKIKNIEYGFADF